MPPSRGRTSAAERPARKRLNKRCNKNFEALLSDDFLPFVSGMMRPIRKSVVSGKGTLTRGFATTRKTLDASTSSSKQSQPMAFPRTSKSSREKVLASKPSRQTMMPSAETDQGQGIPCSIRNHDLMGRKVREVGLRSRETSAAQGLGIVLEVRNGKNSPR